MLDRGHTHGLLEAEPDESFVWGQPLLSRGLQTHLSPAVHHEGDALFRPLRDLFAVRQALEAAVGGVLRVLDEQLVQHRSFVGLGQVQRVRVVI